MWLDPLLPARIDNSYRGHRLAVWLFGLVVLVKLAMSLGTIFDGREVAATADGIPLDAFGPAGAQTVVSLMALLVMEYLSRRLVLRVIPIPRTGAPAPAS